MRRIILSLIAVVAPMVMSAQSLIIPDILKGDIVLQQQTNTGVWGKALPGADVLVTTSWDATIYRATADADSLWSVRVATPEASFTPRAITIKSGNEKVVLENILIGDVWLCGGQSNMEMPLKGMFNCHVDGAAEAIATSGRNSKGLRYVTVAKHQATESVPGYFTEGTWKKSGPGTAADFSAVGYFFGELLYQTLDTPIGLISCNWSGSFVEDWMSKELYEEYPDQKVFGAHFSKAPTKMYYGMLEPIFNYAVKGMIWYQGESNVGSPDYTERLAAAVDHWKTRFGNETFPFYMVELAPYPYNQGYEDQCPYLRVQQYEAGEIIPDGGMVSTYDLAYEYEITTSNIHPARKMEVGHRLAYLALSEAYGFGNPAKGPVYKSMTVEADGSVILTFDNAPNGYINPGEIIGFEIAGADKVFHPAKAQLTFARRMRLEPGAGRSYVVKVSSARVKNPVAVRYAFKDYAKGNLYNVEGLPAVPFRTDNW